MKLAGLSRTAMHTGPWYTANPAQLDAEINTYLDKAQAKQGSLRALIGPHAGYRFSGPNLAWAYKNVIDPYKYDRVFVIGPSHKVFLDFMGTSQCGIYETPLGGLQIDHETIEELEEACQANGGKTEVQRIDKRYEENEHSLEMHLPYIRKMFAARMENEETDIKIVPLMMGQIPEDSYQAYADMLLKYFEDEKNVYLITEMCGGGELFDKIIEKEYFDETYAAKIFR